jgi:hypothetical protein
MGSVRLLTTADDEGCERKMELKPRAKNLVPMMGTIVSSLG